MKKKISASVLLLVAALFAFRSAKEWQSKFLTQNKDGSLTYNADEQGNVIPDFSRVGFYAGDKDIPTISVAKTVSPSAQECDATEAQ